MDIAVGAKMVWSADVIDARVWMHGHFNVLANFKNDLFSDEDLRVLARPGKRFFCSRIRSTCTLQSKEGLMAGPKPSPVKMPYL